MAGIKYAPHPYDETISQEKTITILMNGLIVSTNRTMFTNG